jgi:hypothetical protein
MEREKRKKLKRTSLVYLRVPDADAGTRVDAASGCHPARPRLRVSFRTRRPFALLVTATCERQVAGAS